MDICVVIILIVLVEMKQGLAANCGELTFERNSVSVGDTAKLIFASDTSQVSREWYKENDYPRNLELLYDSKTSAKSTKYFETRNANHFTLTIMNVDGRDAGSYIIYCGGSYSDRAKLNVTTSSAHRTQTTCGNLSFERIRVSEGESAKLIYSPLNVHASLQWNKRAGNTTALLYGGVQTSSTPRYRERKTGDQYTLTINRLQLADAGEYIVFCGSGWTPFAKLEVISSHVEDNESTCGNLSIVENNLEEGKSVHLQFHIQPGRGIIWERKVNSSFIQMNDTYPIEITQHPASTLHQLIIHKSEYMNSGEYRVNCGSSVSNSVHVTIVPSVPSKPGFENIEDIDTCQSCIPAELNKSVVVKCLVKGGSKPIELNMLKSGYPISNVERSSYEQNATRYTALSYTFTPTEEDMNTPTFTCTVKNPAMKIEMANTTKLYVKVDPETVDIEIQPVKENETAKVQCITTRSRPPKRTEIYFNNKRQSNAHIISATPTGHTYSVTTSLHRSFSRFENQGRAMCCSIVSKRNCSKAKLVNVKFPPTSVKLTELKKLNEENGDTQLTLNCSMDESNPKSKIDWQGIKNLKKQQLKETYRNHSPTHGWTFTTTWVFNLTKDDNYRNIRCNVLNQEFPELVLKDSYKPNITYSPVIEISGRMNRTVYTGDDVKLTCHVESNPPSVITWYNKTDKISESYGQGQIDLRLTNVSLDHSQTYSCTASNNIGGLKSRNVTLIVKDVLEKSTSQRSSESEGSSIAGPIIGVAVVLVVAIVAVTIFLTVRKKKQNAASAGKPAYQIQIEERKASTHPTGNEPIYDNEMGAADENEGEEQPEYASVIPKSKRVPESEKLNPRDPNKKKEDTLVYAELDLDDGSEKSVRPLASKYEPTEYVSIDFTKTGPVLVDENEESEQ